MRHRQHAFLALLVGFFCAVFGVLQAARATTYAGTPLSGTATVTSLAVSGTPALFLAGNTGVNTAIQGGMFWSDTTAVLIFQDGSGGATIGVLGITASVPLPVTPTHFSIGGAGQPGSGICTVTKGAGIYVTTGANGPTPKISWTGPVNQQ